MQKQTSNKSNKVANKQGDKAMKKAQAQQKVRIEDTIYELVGKASEADKNIKMQKVTGYVSVKYGNKVLFEFHDKKKSISHLTFSNKQQAFAILKENKLIHRVVPASYGWKYNTECLLTQELAKKFPAILKSVIEEAVAERNLKEKTIEKKVAKA